ncbi:sorting nexin-21 isoform X2 [Xiphias gladius]|nr:sorting nexin-21 isoform X2 [Xiphias gladius]XP_040008441.1 sorting nexin-21 isoform X2 [Xiphias gladius]XP_040008442.1 sorting nexin-21 isoform X2 [Xiphias gladius]XP_040008444.1 sorting nexin-21 isoform X2 [Xiphias gladius]XP_040008445.1 sorting nexin-21 isoform X2 [Xiphias gladius]
MASRLLDRLKRSLFKDGQGAGTEQEAGGGQEEEEFNEDRWEAELAEEEECVTDRLGGTLCFDGGGGGMEDGAEGEGSGLDSDSDFLGESMEEGLSSTDTSPVGVSPVGPSPSSPLTRQLQESWRNLRGLGGGSPAPSRRRLTDNLLFEVTDASVVQDGSSKYVLYTIHVIQSGGSDKTPAIITRRYSDFQRLHATLRRNHGDQMERVCFPRKKLRRNFTAETIAKRSRAFEQYLSHLCSLSTLRGALCVRQFFYLTDLQTGQLLIRVGRYQEALGPLLNAKRLQDKLGWAGYYDNQAQAPPPASFHWFFTLVGLSCCFQEVDQLEEARDHCDLALRVLTPAETQTTTEDEPLPLEDKPHPLSENPLPQTDATRPRINRPHPLLLPLLRAAVRLSWQTGKDKRHWEELLQQLEEQGAGLDNQPTVKEFLVKHNLQESEAEA